MKRLLSYLRQPVKIALNEGAGVTIENIKAAIVCEKTGKGQGLAIFKEEWTDGMLYTTDDISQPAVFDLFAKNPLEIKINNTSLHLDIVYNPELQYLRKGIYKLINRDTVNKRHRFATDLVDLDKFLYTSVLVRDSTKIYLKLAVTMRPKDPGADQTPIVYIATYEVPQANFVPDDPCPGFLFTCDQQMDLLEATKIVTTPSITSGDIKGIVIETQGNVTVNATQNVNFMADNEIRMKPGFNGKPTSTGNFATRFIRTYECIKGSNAKNVISYFAGCDPDPLFISDPVNKTNKEEITSLVNQVPKLYSVPNPNRGNFSLIFNKKIESGTVRIMNVFGQIVLEQKIQPTEVVDISVEGVAKGVYFIKYVNNSNSMHLQEKMIIE